MDAFSPSKTMCVLMSGNTALIVTNSSWWLVVKTLRTDPSVLWITNYWLSLFCWTPASFAKSLQPITPFLQDKLVYICSFTHYEASGKYSYVQLIHLFRCAYSIKRAKSKLKLSRSFCLYEYSLLNFFTAFYFVPECVVIIFRLTQG